jgi:hypothetical protein
VPEQEWHINFKEMMAVFLTIQHFEDRIAGQVVQVRSDNTTTCVYINKGGGTRSHNLCHLAIRMWDWCIQRQIELRAVHVPGVQNLLADHLSRREIDHREWSLHGQVVNRIFLCWKHPEVDLFASCHNYKMTSYCSLYRFPGALAHDAFSIDWNQFSLAYAFPPVVILARVLRKVATDRAKVILIAPRWPMRAWYTAMLEMLVDFPRSLPCREDLLSQFKILHPDPNNLKLTAWRLSGCRSEQRDFRTKLLRQSYSQDRPAPGQVTTPSGAYLFAGVVRGAWIPILPL